MRTPWLIWIAWAGTAGGGAAAAEAGLAPFSAHYGVEWHGFSVGTGEVDLSQDPASGTYRYVMKLDARGIARLFLANEATQISRFAVVGDHARPLQYRGDDGSADRAKRVWLDFDWVGAKVTGSSEGKPVDLPLPADTQDPMSIQVELMLALIHERGIGTLWLADKDEVKDFIYKNEGRARLRTALGELDTIALAGSRPGSDRVTRLWFAPALGFVPVQAQRLRKGKAELSMFIRGLKSSAR